MKVVLYTDASHCPVNKVAACSFLVRQNGWTTKRSVILIGSCHKTATAEIFAVIQALQYAFLIPDVSEVVLLTDYLPTSKYQRRGKAGYIGFYLDPCFKELKETIDLYDEYSIKLDILWVRGHASDRFNHEVDRSANKHLRNYIKKQGKQELLFKQ